MNATRKTETSNEARPDAGSSSGVRRFSRREFALVAVVVCGLGVAAGLARWFEVQGRPAAAEQAAREHILPNKRFVIEALTSSPGLRSVNLVGI